MTETATKTEAEQIAELKDRIKTLEDRVEAVEHKARWGN